MYAVRFIFGDFLMFNSVQYCIEYLINMYVLHINLIHHDIYVKI